MWESERQANEVKKAGNAQLFVMKEISSKIFFAHIKSTFKDQIASWVIIKLTDPLHYRSITKQQKGDNNYN